MAKTFSIKAESAGNSMLLSSFSTKSEGVLAVFNRGRLVQRSFNMITPKVKEIEEKFGNNQPFTQEDINTLLLKSQYNHINHLDMKLNEVTADVASLKHEFRRLEQKVDQRFENFEQRFETFEQRFDAFEHKVEATIQKALNRNMLLMVAALGFFVTLDKVLAIFAK